METSKTRKRQFAGRRAPTAADRATWRGEAPATHEQRALRPGVVSIVVATYDRPATLRRALESVLGQDSSAWELVVVDDGQRQGTTETLRQYDDPRLVVVRHDRNRGTSAARNTGLDAVGGEWFTFLDDDDEILPHAVSTLMRVASEHPDVDAITCNCIDSQTGLLSGAGLESSQYVDFPATYSKLRGEHWGITKTALLRGRRFDERLSGGFEGTLWLKLSSEARRYYLHEGLRVFHTEGADRVSHTLDTDLAHRAALLLPLADDAEYLALLRRYNRQAYTDLVFYVALALIGARRRREALASCRDYSGTMPRKAFLLAAWVLGPRWIAFVSRVKSAAHEAREHLT
jgi:glycosyltransferase involved in cell wall biosynthesis